MESLQQEEAQIAHQISMEKVRLLTGRAFISIFTNILTSSILIVSCMACAATPAIILWATLMIGVTSVRLFQVKAYQRDRNSHSAEEWLDAFVKSAFVMGCVWGLGIVWMAWGITDIQLAVIAFLVAGMTAGSAVFGAAHKPLALAYSIPMIIGFIAVLLSQQSFLHYMLAATVVLYGVLLWLILDRSARTFEDSSHRGFKNEQLAQRLSLALAREESARAAQTQLVANVSHELRTPLGAVIGMIDLAQISESKDKRRSFLGIARESANSLRIMLDDLLEVSKLDLGHLDLKSELLDPVILVQSVSDLFRIKAQDAGLELGLEIDWPQAQVIAGDNNRVRQILVNLVGNALKFTAEGEICLELRATCDEDGALADVVFKVRDTGVGIPEASRDRIFERFEQVDGSTNRAHQGAGLGLAISRELARAMGGDISVESRLGYGSCFTFTLPYKPIDTVQNDITLESLKASEEKVTEAAQLLADEAGPIRVLVVDDNEINCVLITAILGEAHIQYEVANSGQEALDILTASDEQQFDVILMDVQMPVMDGIEATMHIRKLDHVHAGVPILAVTANAFKEQRTNCLNAGMQGFVVKPIEADFLVDEVRRVAQFKTPQQNTRHLYVI